MQNILTPVGRMVEGSLYKPNTTDAEGNPLVVKHGPNAGQPRVEFYFAIAIPKGPESRWQDTPWGQIIESEAKAGFPQGQWQYPSFAWKVVDGDSQEPNRRGRKPCEREGYPRHWVLKFSSGMAPRIVNKDGTQQLTDPDAIKPGYYIQVYGNVRGNESPNQPGVFLNHQVVSLTAYGEEIAFGPDPASMGFGQGVQLPAGASATPVAGGFNPAPAQDTVPQAAPPQQAVAAPNPAFLLTPPPVAPPAASSQRAMTPKAGGATYEQFIAQGWTDAQLVEHGYMLP